MENQNDALKTQRDPRWTDKDKVKQLKGIAELHERTLKWMKLKKKSQVQKYQKEGKALDRKTEKLRRLLKEMSAGDSIEVKELLMNDKEAWLSCKDKAPEEIIESLKHLIFVQRRELDRLNFDMEATSRTLYETRLEEKMTASGLTEEEKLETAKFRIQELAAEIKHVQTQTKAAHLVEQTFDKLRRIIKKESLDVDTLLDGLKADILIQSECILKAMDMGQSAIEDKANFLLRCKNEMRLSKHEKESIIHEIKSLKTQIARVRKINSSVARSDSFHKMEFTGNDEKFKIIEKLKQKVNERDDQFKILMEATTANSPHEVFLKIEDAMNDRYSLLRKLQVYLEWRDTEIERKKNFEFTNKLIEDQEIIQLKGYKAEKVAYEEKIKNFKALIRRSKLEASRILLYLNELRLKLFHFQRLFTDVRIGDPGPSLIEMVQEDEDDDIFEGEEPDEAIELDTPEIGGSRTESSLELEIDATAAHIADVISLKLTIILKDLEEYLQKKRTESETAVQNGNILLDFNVDLDDDDEGDDDESALVDDDFILDVFLGTTTGDTDDEYDSGDEQSDDEIVFRRNPPTRIEIKYKSQRVCDYFENADSTLNQQQTYLKRHVCY